MTLHGVGHTGGGTPRSAEEDCPLRVYKHLLHPTLKDGNVLLSDVSKADVAIVEPNHLMDQEGVDSGQVPKNIEGRVDLVYR